MAPRNAVALAGLADAYTEIVDYTCLDIRPCNEQAAKARRLAAEALRLDPKSAAAHASQAQVLRILDRNYAASDAEFRIAISLDPSYAPARALYGFSLLRRGLFSDARAQLLSAAALDPVATATNSALAEDAYFTRNFQDAIRYAKDALVLDPQRAETLIILGMAYERLGKYNASIRAYNDARHAGWDRKDVAVLIATAESERGDGPAGERAARTVPNKCSENVALLFAALHRFNDATRALRCMVEGSGDPFAAERRFDPRLEALKGSSVGS
jgi:Tfp pilus assembly protein PilF